MQKAREIINETFSPLIARGMTERTVKTAIEFFTLGLNTEVAAQVIGKSSETLEEAISTAINCERHVKQRKELHEDKTEDNHKSAYCHVTKPRNEDEPEAKKRTCFQCGKPGVITRNYPQKRAPYCNFCRLEVHTFNTCRRRPDNPSPPFTGYAQQEFSNNRPLNSHMVHHTGASMNPNVSAPQPAPSSLPPLMGLNPRW